MPKVVDPVERRRHIFDALFDVVFEHGIEQVSLRRVADTAGLAIGSVRHYFDSQAELLRGAADELIERIGTRLERHRDRLTEDDRQRQAVALDMLCELFPQDPASAREATVWLELSVAARTNPVLRGPAETLFRGSRVLAARIVERACDPVELDTEAERLAALIDGLALHGALYPDLAPHELARAVAARHLAELADRVRVQQ